MTYFNLWFLWFAGIILLTGIAQIDKVKMTNWIRFLIVIWPLSVPCYLVWNFAIMTLNKFKYFWDGK